MSNFAAPLKEALPDLHIHGFSPEEVLYGSTLTGASIRDYLSALKDAGVGSLPGTSAEVFVDEVRQRISPGRISIDSWIEVIQTAHEVGIPTTSTIMYGHIETARHRAIHLERSARRAEAHRRHHRVRAAELRLRRSADVPSPGACPSCAMAPAARK